MKLIYMVKTGDLSDEIKKNTLKIIQKLIDKEAEAIIAGYAEIPFSFYTRTGVFLIFYLENL